MNFYTLKISRTFSFTFYVFKMANWSNNTHIPGYPLDAQSDDFTLTGSTGNKIGRLAVVCKIKDILLLPFKNNKLEIFNF